MSQYPEDIYTEPSDTDVDTLANLGPLRPMAGIWRGKRGLDVNPKEDGPKKQAQLIELPSNCSRSIRRPMALSCFTGCVTTRISPSPVKSRPTMIRSDTGWEPATHSLIHTLTFRVSMVTMANGTQPDSRTFELVATHADQHFGIRSAPFLDHAFKTVRKFRIKVTISDDDTWGYDEDTTLMVRGQSEHVSSRSQPSDSGGSPIIRWRK